MAVVAKSGNWGMSYSTDSGTTWLNIPGVLSFDIGNIEAEELDATDADSTGNQREYVNGFKDANDGSIRLHNKPLDTALQYLRTAVGGAAVDLRARIDGEYHTFQALIKSFGEPVEIGQIMTVDVGIKLTGAVTHSAVV